ncbi:GH39 family glycosyl hydrolase [Cerasicoccus maritimus]|uniref:GH39 family glycosyl hydrolase n=1 Tax=Cerasicoccus maritimus TaxID=490089 RepID=UPI0028529869|nr:discoidin domain-containing protein [Cerasicoccus maritimus]
MSYLISMLRKRLVFTAVCAFIAAAHVVANISTLPSDSLLASPSGKQQLLMLSAIEPGDVAERNSLNMSVQYPEANRDLEAKVGDTALQFSGEAEGAGAKGDFRIHARLEGDIVALGSWIYLADNANVKQVGFQVRDSEGEAMEALVDADWTGWQWVEFNVDASTFATAYSQDAKNGEVDQPIKSVQVVWYARSRGLSEITVDGLFALSEMETTEVSIRVELLAADWGEPGDAFRGRVLVHNYQDVDLSLPLSGSLQTNPRYLTPELPRPGMGSDHAQGQTSWFVIDGERLEDNSLTDGADDTCLTPSLAKGQKHTVYEMLDLGQVREIQMIEVKPGDGNWIRKIDIETSVDGKNFEPVAGLQGIDLQKSWGYVEVKADAPFKARLLRIRHHDGDQELPGFFRSLASIHVYDGAEDEVIGAPQVGDTVFQETLSVEVPARSFQLVEFSPSEGLGSNAYQYALSYQNDGLTYVKNKDYFVMPEGEVAIRPDSRFGINVNSPRYVPEIKRLGFGWVRFENLKWPFYNPAPKDFRFDGSVAPWNVPMDEYFAAFNEAGLSILPYIFETPKWATSAGPDIKKNRKRYPPIDYADYGEAIYQAVARYGQAEADVESLYTNDKRTGLNYMQAFEIWNEPNLTAPSWGFFIGTLEEFYELFRVGAEAVKKADSQALRVNGGWAGITMDWIDTMQSFTYEDGKTPLDFTDVLSVHYYTGKQDPETATRDPNANRTGKGDASSKIIEEYLIDLADWRDKYKADMPIWVTEMGYDVGGPIGRTERHQAAKLPRGCMLGLANGVQKMMLYRIAGSTPTHHGGAGLIRNDGSLRASFFTMATLIRQMDGVTAPRSYRLLTDDPDVWIYLWREPNGYFLSAHVPKGVAPLGLDLGECEVTNAFGGVAKVDLTADYQLSDFPIYIRSIEKQGVVDQLLDRAIAREVARREKIAFMENARAYLIDFGTHEHVGQMKVGSIRPFVTVVKEDAYDEVKGYGFTSKVSGKNMNAGWLKDPLEKDFVQLHRPATFRINLDPGTYTFQFKAIKYRNGGELILSGGREGEISVPLPMDNDAAPTQAVRVTVLEGQPINMQLPPCQMQWLSFISDYTK